MPAVMDRRENPKPTSFPWLVALAGAIVVFQFAANGWVAYRHGLEDRYGFELAEHDDGVYVKTVFANGPAVGRLHVGDKIIALDDLAEVSRIGWRDLVKYRLRNRPDGASYTLRVVREGREQSVKLELLTYRPPNFRTRLQIILSSFIVSLSPVVMGLLVGALKPRDCIARIAFGAMTLFGCNYLFFFVIDRQLYLLSASEPGLWFWSYVLSGGSIYIALSYHLYYDFPGGSPAGPFWRRLKWILYGFGLLVYVGGIVQRWVWLQGAETTVGIAAYAGLEFYRTVANELFTLLGSLAVVGISLRHYRLVNEPFERRRITLIIFGAVAPLLLNVPLYLFRLILALVGYSEVKFTETFTVISWLINFTLILAPISWAYAILKHRVLDVRLVVRRGVRYLLAKNVLRALLVLPILATTLQIGLNAERPLTEILFAQPLNLGLIALAALSLLLRGKFQSWLDRRFFREEYRQERVLLELIEKIKHISLLPELTETVHQQIETALHPRAIHLYYCERELIYTGTTRVHQIYLTLPSNAALPRLLDGTTEPQDFPSTGLAGLPPSERQWLEHLEVHLLVPLNGTAGRLIGLLLLGEKQSELPYLREDRALLKSVAHQMAVVCENLSLREQVSQERKIKHDVLARLDGRQVNLLTECPLCGLCYDRDESYCKQDNQPLTLTLPVERTIDGKYRLDRRVGAGGMGAVYAATDLRLKRRVAVKLITGSLFGNQAALLRFTREAQASARLNHPNIVAVHDYGQVGAEGAYLVMEFLTGASLRAEMNHRGACPPSLVADWFAQILAGLGAAHEAGVLHRDLKPDNVWLAAKPDGRTIVKLLDFGLAKLRPLDVTGDTSLTVPGTVLGTPGYMAPEQLVGRKTDERSDVFSVGVMVVEALTGRRPFEGKTYAELQAALATQPYHLPGETPELVHLNAVLQGCLAYDRQRRYANTAKLAEVLLPALRACARLSSSFSRHAPQENLPTTLKQKLHTRETNFRPPDISKD